MRHVLAVCPRGVCCRLLNCALYTLGALAHLAANWRALHAGAPEPGASRAGAALLIVGSCLHTTSTVCTPLYVYNLQCRRCC
jgi:hypothetical protein